MKLLCVVSTLNFPQFTRRATIEAIHRLHPDTELLMFSSLKNLRTRPVTLPHIKTRQYRFWLPEALKGNKMLVALRHEIKSLYWKRFFQQYEVVFLTDPNQYYLLPYLQKQKVVYLIRDPNVLQSPKNHPKELAVLERANVVLATSKNLAEIYLPKYYGFQHPNIHYWPNTVDLNIWDIDKFKDLKPKNTKPVLGMAGNLNNRSDLGLLDYISEQKEFHFEVCGNIFLNDASDKAHLDKILAKSNVKHLGFLPFSHLPAQVNQWDLGLTIEKPCDYTYFTHHNKIYQYMALGKPVVNLRTHNDYDTIGFPVFIANTKEEYSQKIKEALAIAGKPETIEHCLKVARENSCEVRARQFLDALSAH